MSFLRNIDGTILEWVEYEDETIDSYLKKIVIDIFLLSWSILFENPLVRQLIGILID